MKTFADGILVHKDYIWPVDTNLYLQPPTSLVKDAHNVGLEIYAANFSNDEFCMRYNYRYDPVGEYIQFVYYNDLGVDGVLTDFCATTAEAIAYYALSSKIRSIPLAATRVDNYVAIDEYIHLTDAENQETDARSLLSSRISESEDLVEWDFSL